MRWVIAWSVALSLAIAFGFTLYAVSALPPLQPWHTQRLNEQFSARRHADLDFIGYLEREDKLFAEGAACGGAGAPGVILQARPAPARRIRTVARLARVVRRSEERFASAEGGPVSLADLCVAAGVSQGTLYHAFTVVIGEPPLANFRKRRLTDARSMLLGAVPERSAIKRAALGAGPTHLGRFSAECRNLFGESPSTTLNESAC